MRTWAVWTGKVPILCGYDPTHSITQGQRYQLVQLRGVKRVGKRCELCADTSEPNQQPESPQPVIRPDFTRVSEIDSPLTRDHKAKRMGAA